MTLDVERRLRDLELALERLRKVDRAPLYLPFTQRVVNPFPLASSGGVWGDTSQPWAVSILALYVSVLVGGTNNATNFWTLDLIDPSLNVIASVNTSAATVATWTRLVDTSISQPSSSNPLLALRCTATLSPGSIFIVPALALVRTGN